MKRYGRSEMGSNGRLVWCVYEAPEEGDFSYERRLATFRRERDARAFVSPDAEIERLRQFVEFVLTEFGEEALPQGHPDETWEDACVRKAQALREAAKKAGE